MTDPYCVVLTAVDSAEAARRLADSIVDARLAACVQVSGPVRSVYHWHGRREQTSEWQLWCKTTVAGYDALAAHLTAAHPYEVPEILQLPVATGHDPYLRWIDAETAH